MTTAGGEGEGGGEKSTFQRCLDATRYTVAAAVTFLMVVVIVSAVKVVLRPESLRFSVAGGSIVSSARPLVVKEETIALELILRAENPSNRARMYYVNITAYLFDKNTSASASPTPEDDSIFYFKPDDIDVPQQEAVHSFVTMDLMKRTTEVDSWVALKLTKDQVNRPYFDMLYNGSRISDTTLRLDGQLVTEVNYEFNKTRPMTSYYCEQLLVGGDPGGLSYMQDVICKHDAGWA
ncbi:hypothetical protein HU200_056457 [Digitaria exilis]|uniref:Late embryogenesis abundant protein LEA-2 subgroup domain-containing protein n=1 Tax=Digitaria exilis TaxID=1010633 RepID=A0A835E0X3_9POAL|nr:hypothetical protein HU200_056457 [Digitaria exilis]